jgi:hypothetical protein
MQYFSHIWNLGHSWWKTVYRIMCISFVHAYFLCSWYFRLLLHSHTIELRRCLLRRFNGRSIIMLSYDKNYSGKVHPRWFQSWCPHWTIVFNPKQTCVMLRCFSSHISCPHPITTSKTCQNKYNMTHSSLISIKTVLLLLKESLASLSINKIQASWPEMWP